MGDTCIFTSERNRRNAKPVVASERLASALLRHAMSPKDVAEPVYTAIRRNQFCLVTTDSRNDVIRNWGDAILERKNPAFPSIKKMSSRSSKSD